MGGGEWDSRGGSLSTYNLVEEVGKPDGVILVGSVRQKAAVDSKAPASWSSAVSLQNPIRVVVVRPNALGRVPQRPLHTATPATSHLTAEFIPLTTSLYPWMREPMKLAIQQGQSRPSVFPPA